MIDPPLLSHGAEQADRRRSDEELRTILATIDAGICVVGRDGTILSCNAAAERILDVHRENIVGREYGDPVWRAIRADGSAFPKEEHPAAVSARTREPVRGVVMGIDVGNAGLRWILINAQPTTLGDDGEPESVVCSFSDITALRHEEEARRRVEAQDEQFFTLSLDLLCIGSQEGRFLRLNPAWTTLLGWSEEELLSRQFVDLVHPDDVAKTIANVSQLTPGSPSVGFENRYRKRDGTYCVLSWSSVATPEKMLLCVARDVTEQRAREEELTRARDAAEAADRAKSEFLATMSHEIRTPMNGVLGLTEVLLGTELDDDQREMLQNVHDSGKALLQILNDILDWSRIEAGRLDLARVSVDAVKVIADVVAVLGAQAELKGLELQLVVAPDANRYALGDAGRVRQVLFNLLGNAVKFTERGSISIRFSRAEPSGEMPAGGCRFDVIDTGIGIATEDQRRLFGRFSQVDGSQRRRFGGSGLGLAISRELVLAMGGCISVDSTPGKGSTFTFVLPAATDAAAHASERVEAPRAARQFRILLAEDNLVNQKVARALLDSDGHEVEIAANGIAAIAAFQRASWDLVLMDVQMPEMDGLLATRTIRDLERSSGKPRVRIVALTASALPEERGVCLAAGMDEVLSKPVSRDDLRRVLLRVE